MIAALLALSTPVYAGTVTYRERIALPPTARIVVTLTSVGTTSPVAELTLFPNGRQVPFRWAFAAPEGRHEVRARIVDGGRVLFQSPSARLAARDGETAVVVRRAEERLSGSFKLIQIEGRSLPQGKAPTLDFGADGRLTGFAGVNRFSGTFRPGEGSAIRLDPGAATRMAGPAPRMELENLLFRLLSTVRTYALRGDTLVLSSERPVVVLRRVP